VSRPVPPSVSEITKLIKNLTETQNPSVAIIKKEAKKVQKEWDFIGELRNFNYLPSPRKNVINGSGILLHTNLGRAPLGQKVIERISATLSGYVDLEIDLQTGDRGGRTHYLDELATSFIPHYKTAWVNNCAAAVLLALNTLKKTTGLDRIIISRGELVEIGGGFRVPEIMEEAGLTLVEVGTTNKTRLSDYKDALKKGPAIIGKIHPSNFSMDGFTESVSIEELIPLAEKFEAPLFFDAGTMTPEELRRLPSGITCITMSTDKTLGSIQGGLLLAPQKIQKKILKNPLYRALRLDKVSLTALEVAFEAHAEKKERKTLPLFEMLHTSVSTLNERAQDILKLELKNFRLEVTVCSASLGGGAQSENINSVGLRLIPNENSRFSPIRIIEGLRQGSPIILATIVQNYATINLLTVLPWQIETLKEALRNLDTRIAHESSAN
jgi:L-seryl-tRNA(Ser) seleniumtransferase